MNSLGIESVRDKSVYKYGKNSSEKLAHKKIKTHKKNIFMMPKNEYAQKLVPI